MRSTIAVVIGTRPEAIKLAPVIAAIRKRGPDPRAVVIATAQHRELLDQVLRVFSVEPDVDLSLMRPDQPLAALTSRAVESLSRTFSRHRPDLVLVQGDTTTSFAGALAAFYHHIPVGHVEAGLRTDDRYHPYPEEINRRLTGALAELHFCPTATALARLRREGVPSGRLFLTGNTVIDAVREAARRRFVPPSALRSLYTGRRGPLVLVTAHRRESHGAPLEAICEALRALVARHPDLTIAYPVHPSPNVRVPVHRLLGNIERIRLLPPLDYLAFVHLMRRATVLLTDSGGIQEEGPGLGIPVLVMRDVTERPEAIAAGAARLVGTDPRRIARETSRLLSDEHALRRMGRVRHIYGDGKAAKRIAALSAAYLSPRGLKSARVAPFRARIRSDRSGR